MHQWLDGWLTVARPGCALVLDHQMSHAPRCGPAQLIIIEIPNQCMLKSLEVNFKPHHAHAAGSSHTQGPACCGQVHHAGIARSLTCVELRDIGTLVLRKDYLRGLHHGELSAGRAGNCRQTHALFWLWTRPRTCLVAHVAHGKMSKINLLHLVRIPGPTVLITLARRSAFC